MFSVPYHPPRRLTLAVLLSIYFDIRSACWSVDGLLLENAVAKKNCLER